MLPICFRARRSVVSSIEPFPQVSDAEGAFTMSRIRITALSRFGVTVNGRPARLTPTNARMLVRLVVAGNHAVSLEDLYRDVWESKDSRINRRERTQVQRQIGQLRKILGPEGSGSTAEVVQTERDWRTAYRLALQPDQVDLWQFEDLATAVDRSRVPGEVANFADRALELWPDRTTKPLEAWSFTATTTRRLLELRSMVQDRLLTALVDLGQAERASALGRAILDEQPGNQHAIDALQTLRARRTPAQSVLCRHAFACAPATEIVLAVGDLFAAGHADLVVGFTDTFDTSTHRDLVISADSTQGQLLTRLYPADRNRLDRELRQALQDVAYAGRETRQAKPHGKLIRYPIGTVAAIRNGQRNIFCVAYSRLGNDFVARSSVDFLTKSLDQLWDVIYRKGGYGEVVMPLVGSGRSRISALDYQSLLNLIADSFGGALARGLPICRELRIVLAPTQLARIDVERFRRHLASRPH